MCSMLHLRATHEVVAVQLTRQQPFVRNFPEVQVPVVCCMGCDPITALALQDKIDRDAN
jgi:hypothetical protein